MMAAAVWAATMASISTPVFPTVRVSVSMRTRGGMSRISKRMSA